MTSILRRSAQLAWRLAIAHGPRTIGAAAARLPFTRFHPLMRVFRGDAPTAWRDVELCVDPGKVEGYYRYFFPHAPDAELDWLLARATNARTFIDVGSNLGIYSLAVAARYPSIQVVAFEPDPGLAERIRANIRRNPRIGNRVRVVEAAVDAQSGRARFAPATGGNSGVGRLVSNSSGAYDVDVVALADWCTREGIDPEMVKIDVEGAELGVLEGLRPLLGRVRALLVELHPQMLDEDARRRIVSIINEAGLTAQYWYDERELRDSPLPVEKWPARAHIFAAASR